MAVEAVWGLDIGQNALKAVKARRSGQLIEVLAFDHIEYRQPAVAGGDSNAQIREALQTFLNRNEIINCEFAVSIAAGRSALIRFIKLPPVDRKKVPDIVRYEATQQIPFPLEDVIWDYQVVEREYTAGEELEVGIFAMRREAIFNFLSNLMVSGIEVGSIQLAAAAVYNCIRFDQTTAEGAVMGVDIGAESTNLIIVDGNDVWTRSLPIGGNDFTRAIATKYSLEFEQAETLKRSMERSAKSQEIFEALRPSLRSMLDEIQRSAGYYRSLHKQAKFVKLIGFGNGFKMHGVQRFLEAGLAYPVEVYGRTNNIKIAQALNLQFFKKNAPAFGAALGLAVQALGAGGINTNLMPPQILKERLLKRKRPMLVGAAAMLAGACVLYAAIAFLQPTAYPIDADPRAKDVSKVSEELDAFKERTDVKTARDQIETAIDLKESKAEALEAFNALISSIPDDEQYPLYVEQISMESGTSGVINNKIRKGWEATGGGGSGLVRTPVERKIFIDEAKAAIAPRSRSGTTRSQREADAIMQSVMFEDIRREQRRAATAERDALEASRGRAAEQVARSEKGLQFRGIGYMAQVTLETANPEGPTCIKRICDAMKKTPGVVHCDYFYADRQTYYENKETHAREMSQRQGPTAKDFEEKVYTVAIVQWVYSPVRADQAARTAAAENQG